MINLLSKWKDKVAQYVDVRLSLAKLAFIERTSNVLSYLIFTFILLFLSTAVLLFFGIGLQEAFSAWVGSRIWGSFLAAAFFLLLCMVAYLLRKPILNAFSNLFVQILTDQGDEDDDDEELDRQAYEQSRKKTKEAP